MNHRTYRGTRYACYTGYVVQAIVNNLAPLLFVLFQSTFRITYAMISTLVLVNFITQLLVDVASVGLVNRWGQRLSLCVAHIMCGLGFLTMSWLPLHMDAPFVGLLIATVIYAIGGGLIEVLVSPTVESLPSDEKAASMSLLHSFYCWGQVAVVLISTVVLRVIGPDYWPLLPLCWSVIPFANAINFKTVPLPQPPDEEKGMAMRELLSSKAFVMALLLMTCAGASELSVSQWASIFAEKSLGVSKVLGDLLGPCMFALLMGMGRLLYSLYGSHAHLHTALVICAGACVAGYLLAALAPWPFLSLAGCGLCGLSVSLMWPGVFSLSAATFRRGGTAMFALLAVFGDIGCAFGPWATGVLSDWAERSAAVTMDSLKCGVLAGTVFPMAMLLVLLMQKRRKQM